VAVQVVYLISRLVARSTVCVSAICGMRPSAAARACGCEAAAPARIFERAGERVRENPRSLHGICVRSRLFTMLSTARKRKTTHSHRLASPCCRRSNKRECEAAHGPEHIRYRSLVGSSEFGLAPATTKYLPMLYARVQIEKKKGEISLTRDLSPNLHLRNDHGLRAYKLAWLQSDLYKESSLLSEAHPLSTTWTRGFTKHFFCGKNH
jgi:hypothetical protein